MKSMAEMIDERNATRKVFPDPTRSSTQKKIESIIGSDPQELNSRSYSKFASSDREDHMTEATLEHPVGKMSESWES